jgi:hypothetical protein
MKSEDDTERSEETSAFSRVQIKKISFIRQAKRYSLIQILDLKNL